MNGRFRPSVLVGSGTRRIMAVAFVLAGVAVVLLPRQAQFFLRAVGQPVADVVAIPIESMAPLTRGLRDGWNQVFPVHNLSEQNHELHQRVQQLRGEVNQWRERALAAERRAALVKFQRHAPIQTVAAQVIGRSTSNWYQGVVLNKGERDGIRVEMGVITPAGVVGQIVKTAGSTSIVLLMTDPNVAIPGLVQRTRDEGIVQGTPRRHVRMKYIPPLSPVRKGDVVVTSGLTDGFPRGVLIGEVARIEEREGDLFQTAELVPVVNFQRMEEVLIVTSARPVAAMPSIEQALDARENENAAQ